MTDTKSEAKSFRQIVGEAIGEASMCWSETPTGVFESTRASAIVDKIFDAFHLEAGMNVTRWVDLNIQLKEAQAKHERVLQVLEVAEKAVNRSRELFAYCAGPTRDVKTGKLLDGARICSEAIAEIESLKK